MKQSLAVRAFLFAFLPVCVLLAGTFWLLSTLVDREVRRGVRQSLQSVQKSVERNRLMHEERSGRLLAVVARNVALKSVLELARVSPGPASARTVEDQLKELTATIECDFMMAALAGEASAVAAVMRSEGGVRGIDPKGLSRGGDLLEYGSRLFAIDTVRVDGPHGPAGTLTIGRTFNLDRFGASAALSRGGRMLQTNAAGVPPEGLAAALATCGGQEECEVRIGAQTYLLSRLAGLGERSEYSIRAVQSIDAAGGRLQRVLGEVFVAVSFLALIAIGVLSLFSARSVAQPMVSLVNQLRVCEHEGILPLDFDPKSNVREVAELAEALNRASTSIREARARLNQVYVSFIDSLTYSLDTRDVYTAGHSRRVSEYSVLIAMQMDLDEENREEIRIGALLHDIGKIGVPDCVLQKPAQLTPEETRLVQEHPAIGYRMLAGVAGFERYLPIVELHHENHDGTGYPHGLRGDEVPRNTRIVHAADAYDAMTSDRPYRDGMSHEDAMAQLSQGAGTQFDPEVVQVMELLSQQGWRGSLPARTSGLGNLARTVAVSAGPSPSAAASRAAQTHA